MKNQLRFVIVGGPNGAGKTTLSKELLKEYKLEYLNADNMPGSKIDKKTGLIQQRISAGKRFISKLKNLQRKKPGLR